MTYQEAKDFRDKYIDLTGKQSGFLNHTIERLLIAPYDISVEELIKIYRQINTAEDNELALQNLGYTNGAMDVYVIWQPVANRVEQMPLGAYLSAAGQK